MDRHKEMGKRCFMVILFAFLMLIQYSTAECNINTFGVHTFGPECQYMCHCKNSESCDKGTGECTDGCDTNWFGPACQYRDLAEGQVSRHSSNRKDSSHQYSFKAHDGDISTCSYTIEESSSSAKPWWRVWFPHNETIRDIYILTKTDRLKYFSGFEVIVEYVPENKNENNNYQPTYKHTCYQHDNIVPGSEHIHVQCEQVFVGNQVRIRLSKKRSQLVLCDLKISAGRNFAFRQSVTASQNNYLPFDAVDGRLGSMVSTGLTGCFAASNTGYKYLDIALGMPIYSYSVNINTKSDDNIKDYQIYAATAIQTGLQLVYDDRGNMPPVTYVHLNSTVQLLRIQTSVNQMVICEVEIYGECPANRCGYDCSEHCYCKSNEDMVHRISGNCTTGCKGRWSGTDGKCNIECDYNKWGTQCQNECGACRTGTCDVVSGMCTGGCLDGYHNTDDYCNTECEDGKYGQNCQSACSMHCRNANCNKTNGACVGGCMAGYEGDTCDQECSDGTYGANCNQTCSAYCSDTCNHTQGTCTSCKPGWKGQLCTTECDDGMYGVGCAHECVSLCSSTCDKTNGLCSQCQPGWKGNFCETECADGFYGMNCGQQCSDKCVDLCSKYSGSCNCSIGWQGNTCHDECNNGTHGDGCTETCGRCKEGAVCNKIDGTCALGCANGFEGSLCVTREADANGGEPSPPVAAIAGACSAVVVIAIVVIVGMLILRRRRQSSLKNSTDSRFLEGKENEWQNVSNDVSDSRKQRSSSKKDSSIYENAHALLTTTDKSDDVQPYSTSAGAVKCEPHERKDDGYYAFDGDLERPKSARAIMKNELANYVKSRLAQQDFFENEFQDIPYGLQYPTLDAKKPGNMGKNRYKALYAYDHSRVILKTLPSEPHSDYINASNIKGYNKDVAYIAAQGPTINNVGDFWRMIWENDVQLIAMVTNLVEETKMKCIQYWVAVGKSKTYGKVTVQTEAEEEFAEFSVRRFQISYEGEERQKHVVHYAYTAWPDKDVPNSTCSLLHFWQKVRKHDKDKSKPWLVHCSAGVGRTGTFIALDYLYDQGIDTGYVDINMCVRNLRDQRVNMVQMKEQYKYLYRIMVEALVLRSTPISLNEFDSYYTDLLTVDTKTNKTKLMLDFESMKDEEIFVTNLEGLEYNGTTDMYTNAKTVANKGKNRYSNILAADEFRPFLSTRVPGTNNYINAVYMPSYNDLHGYLLTQTPLPDTAVDCCRLVIEQEIHVIVTFDDDGDNTVGVYLPSTGTITVGPFTVTFNSEEEKDGYVIRRYTFKLKSKEQTVAQLTYKGWSLGSPVPEKPLNMLQVLHEVDGLQRQFENKPVLAQCFNGADRSGVFVVLMNVIERARIDEGVCIPQVIRYLRTRRHIISNYEQYKFCHDVFRCYSESNATYANM